MPVKKFCVYCGKPIKSDDKFCIHCGKPRLANLSKTEKKPKAKKVESPPKDIPEKVEEVKEEEKTPLDEIEEVSEEEELEEDVKDIKEKKKKKAKKVKEEKEEEEVKEIKPLPDEVKQQIEYYLELNDIKSKKLTLADKLKDFQKLMRSDQYDSDFEFGENIQVQLKAVKTLIEELKQKENDLKQKMDEKFIIERLDLDIKKRKDQLKNLVREHKLKKIKDKDVVNKLKERYKQQLEDLTTERVELIAGIELWIDEIKEEEVDLSTERKFNKGRFSAKEISKEEFKPKDDEFEKQLNKLKNKIKTLQNLTK